MRAPATRDCPRIESALVLDKWLNREDLEAVSGVLDVRRLSADGAVDEQALGVWLGHELLRNYLGPKELEGLEAAFRDLGMPEVAEHLKMHKFPTQENIRTGDFGEALGGALFRRVRRWCVPILKLRFKQRPNQPVQGVDFLALRLRRRPAVVAAPEVKTRTRKDLDVGVEAATSLQNVLEVLPSSIQFVAARLLEQGSPIAHRVARLLVDGYEVERHIVLVHDDEEWDDRIVERLADAVSARTETTVIRLSKLKETIASAYSAAAVDPARTAARRRVDRGAERA
jgi:hypothetical protein